MTRPQLMVLALTVLMSVNAAKSPLRRMRKMLHIPDLVESTPTNQNYLETTEDLFARLLEGHYSTGSFSYSLSFSLSFSFGYSNPYENKPPVSPPVKSPTVSYPQESDENDDGGTVTGDDDGTKTDNENTGNNSTKDDDSTTEPQESEENEDDGTVTGDGNGTKTDDENTGNNSTKDDDLTTEPQENAPTPVSTPTTLVLPPASSQPPTADNGQPSPPTTDNGQPSPTTTNSDAPSTGTGAPSPLTSDPLEVDEDEPNSCSNFGACAGLAGLCCPDETGAFKACCWETVTWVPAQTGPTTTAPVSAPLNEDSVNATVTPGNTPTIAPATPPGLPTTPTVSPVLGSPTNRTGSDFPSFSPSGVNQTDDIISESVNRTDLILERCGVTEEVRSNQLRQELGDDLHPEAFTFMDENDDRTVCANAEAQQRYTLSVLYFELDGPNWSDNSNWLSAAHECDWFGIECVHEMVIKITLKDNGLSGILPSKLFELTTLTGLSLDHNAISGSIPDNIGNLQNLTYIELDDNDMEGVLPDSLFEITGLKALDINGNSFSGSITPEQIGNLTNLVVLQIEDNQFSGPLPWFGLVIAENLLVLYTHGNNWQAGGSLDSLCAVVDQRRELYPGYLQFMTADCDMITCSCCSQCFNQASGQG